MPATTAPEVELYVRSLASRTGCQDRVIKQLQRLESEGSVESVTVHVWGEEVGLSTTAVETPRGQSILDAVGRFRSWADENGVSIAGFSERRTRVSGRTGEEYTALRLPVLALAEYEDGDLVSVTPHERESGVRSVPERLEMLATRVDKRPRPDRAEP